MWLKCVKISSKLENEWFMFGTIGRLLQYIYIYIYICIFAHTTHTHMHAHTAVINYDEAHKRCFLDFQNIFFSFLRRSQKRPKGRWGKVLSSSHTLMHTCAYTRTHAGVNKRSFPALRAVTAALHPEQILEALRGLARALARSRARAPPPSSLSRF
jgi:hypothetical protein